MSSNPEEIKCPNCDYKTVRPYNLRRHMLSKHTVKKPDAIVTKPDDFVTKPDAIVAKPDDFVKKPDANICNLCSKVFDFKCRLFKHSKTCKGKVDARTCDYCKKSFTHIDSKYHHHKICKERIMRESQALTLSNNNGAAGPSVINNTTNTHTNSHNTVTNNNIQNQTNNLVVVYNSETMQFNNSHIDPEEIEKLFSSLTGEKIPLEQLDPYAKVMRNYVHQLLSNDNNKCVKKTNIRSSHSQVHVGNNNWESRLDKEVYPNLMNNIANDFSDFFGENYSRHVQDMYKSVQAFLDYMASNGYCSDDDEKKVEYLFNTFVKELKLHVFDNSKKNHEKGVPVLAS